MSRNRDRATSRRPAFTLIELLLVLVVLGLVVGIASTGSERLFPSQKLKSAARQIADTFSLYRDRAMIDQISYKIRCESVSNSLVVEKNENHLFKTVRRYTLPEGIHFSGFEVVGSGRVDSGWIENRLTGDGNMTGQRLWLANEKGETLGLEIHPLLNQVQFLEKPGEKK